jgi:hypothetical protein
LRLRLIGAALLLFLAVQTVVLARARGNRSGTPEARVALTERELWPASFSDPDEDTGLQLRLRWAEHWRGEADPQWLGAGKLRALGFDVSVPPGDEKAEWAYRAFRQRRVWVALEMEGEAWRDVIRRRRLEIQKVREEAAAKGNACGCDPEAEEKGLARDLISDSRLFAVDAALDPEALRRTYPDRSRFLILPATVRVSVQHHALEEPKTPPFVGGSLADIAVPEMDVPLRLRPVFEEARRRHDREQKERLDRGEIGGTPPAFRAVVAVGHRREPWIAAAELLPAPAAAPKPAAP